MKIYYYSIFIILLLGVSANAQNKNISNGVVFDGEPFLTINPNNSQHIVVAWMGFKLGNALVIKTRVSFDAGQTWSTTVSIPHAVIGYTSADPSLKFDNNGNLFLSFIDHIENPITGAVYVVKSSDGGLNWGAPIEVINANADASQFPIDRPWMAVDISGGINDGNIYITTMSPNRQAPTAPFHPYFMKSINGGASFLPFRYLDSTNYLAGNLIRQPMPTPCLAADGVFHAIYPSFLLSQSFFAQYIHTSSSDAGVSFDYNIALQTTGADTNSLPKKGYTLIANPSNANHLMYAYPHNTNGDLDVFMIESLDAGINWTQPLRVNDDPIGNNRMQDLIWLDFDTDGDVIITWRDRRNAIDSTYEVSSEIYGAVRWKDSTNFSPNFPITDTSVAYNSILSNNGNDFMCVNMINDTIYSVWGDTKSGFLNIWFQQTDLSSGVTTIKDLANNIKHISTYPNPTLNKLTINFGDNELINAHYEIINLSGKVVEKQNISSKSKQVDLSTYAKGVYLLKFTNDKGSQIIKLIKE